MQDTTITDSFGRSVAFSEKRFCATSFAGLLPLAHIANQTGLFEPVLRFLEERFPSRHNTLVSAQTMFKQRLFALAAGYEDLNDHESLCNDPGFLAAVGQNRIAGASRLCRFENEFDRHDIDKLNAALLEAFHLAAKKLKMLPSYRRKNYRCLFLDVDSTYVDLYGNQEEKSYNGHYQRNCLAPVLCYLHGYPIAVFGAGGTKDARKVLEPQFKRLIKRIKSYFPDYVIVLRGDAGFNSKVLIDTCDESGIKYITGLPPNAKAEKCRIKYHTKKMVPRYTTAGKASRIVGGIDYQSKNWSRKRRVVARKQYDQRTHQADLRLIQTNIVHTTDRNHEGFCGELSSISNEKLYEQSYCARANMERWIGEFKSECYGARASASKFTTNSWRMILAMLCQLLLKIARRFRLLGLQKCGSSKRNCVERTVRVFRRDNICVTARVDTSAKRLTLTLPVHLHDEEGFRVMFAIPI